ncbi:cytochrome P450 [Yinghuangia sp. YIM S09857]|uniref:cytochrome P450 n=1 Tax=Yinghuangia sp. YIM S09857 TaxID=3436929 RepID=UPI003F536D23
MERLDLMDPGLFVSGVPHDYFAYLREHDPIAWHDESDGTGYWLITRFDDVVDVNRDWRRYSNWLRASSLEDPATEEELRVRRLVFVNQDPKQHTRTRKLVRGAFTPRRLQQLTDQIETICTDLVDELLAAREVDFVTDVSRHLPFRMVARMFGVPEEDWDMVLPWVEQITNNHEPEHNPGLASRFEVQRKALDYGHELIARARRDGGDGILAELLDARIEREDGTVDRLSDDEIASFILIVVIGGVETTSHAVAEAVGLFADHPDLFDRLKREGGCPGSLVEEIVRWGSPAMNFRRTATEDHVLHGRRIKAGDKVVISFSSANRDERHFPDPHAFDPWRTPNDHIGFGGGGPHFCIGAQLARLDIRLMLDELLRRVDRFERAGEPVRLRSNAFAGWLHLPVTAE